MKTLPVRHRPDSRRPIRAIAFEAAPDTNPQKRQRDSCKTLKFVQQAAATMPKEWADLANTLDETARNGPPQNDQKFSFIADSIHEFKAWRLRIACFFDDHLIICTHGFFKKQQKTPKGELQEAKKLKAAYFDAKKRGNLEHVIN